MDKLEKLAGPVAVVVAGVMIAGYILATFSGSSTYIAKAKAGFQ